MNFGLGLILSLTDNATAGINNAVNSLNQLTQTAEGASKSLNDMASLSALSVVSGQIGNSFTRMGHNILSTISQVINGVTETGSTLYYAKNQLSALYGSAEKGAGAIAKIQEYAKTSMFEFENLIPAVTSLKSVGIEAFDAIASSTGDASHNLLDYASALASFAPQMKNAYGTGINAAIGAMREYIAEGNALSLKRGAGLDITGILGEDKGATIEDRTRQVADLINTLNMMPMVETMKNSPMTMLSNMGDVLFQLKGMISDSGVYDKFTDLISKLATYVMAIPEEELQEIANVIGSALTAIMTPLDWVADRLISLVDGLRSLVQTNPQLVKFATIGVTVFGVLLLLAGIALKAMSAFSGLSLMVLAFGNSFKKIGGIFKAGSIKVLGALLPLVATIGLLAIAWKNDLFGIKTVVTNFVTNLTTSFKTARKAVNGDVADLISTLEDLKSRDDFFSELTIGIMKVMMLGKALSDAWGDYTLSEDNFLKAKELGILPLIEAILDLKYRLENFISGFKDGMKQISTEITSYLSEITANVQGTFLEPIINGLTDFFRLLSGGDAKAWYDFGKVTANIVTIIAGLAVAFKVVGIAVGVITKVVGVFKALWGIITFVGGAFMSILGFIGTVATAILGFFGFVTTLPATVVGAIVLALVAIVALIIKYRDKIFEALKSVGSWIYNNVILPVKNFFVGLWKDMIELFRNIGSTVGGAIKEGITTAINWVLSKAVGIINGFIDAINFVLGVINAIPGVNISKLNRLAVPQLAEGGVVTKPTMSIIGEAGAEAVVPLENNTGWIEKLAGMVSSEMSSVNKNHNRSGGYLTGNSHTSQGSTDNSVVFNEGAIQVVVQNATEEEAVKLAKKIMEYIKRQNQLNSMLNYA